MNVLVWSYIFISFSYLQDTVDILNMLNVDFAIRILNIFNSDNRSLCIFLNESNISDDQKYLYQVLTKITGRNARYSFITEEENFEIFVQDYFKCRKNQERYFEIFVSYFIPYECRLNITGNNGLSKWIITMLKSQKSYLGIETCTDFLAFACEFEIFYRELFLFSRFVYRNEQELTDIIVFNNAKISEEIGSSFKKSYISLVEQAHHFMRIVLGSGQQFSIYVTLCLVSKSIDYYDYKHVWIMESYVKIMLELKNNETCELSTFEEGRRTGLLDILKEVDERELNEIERNGVFYGFENFFSLMKDTILDIVLGMYHANSHYFTNECNFNSQQFSTDYDKIIQDVLGSKNNQTVIPNVINMVMIFCMYSNIKMYREIQGDPQMITALPRIITSYYILTLTLTNKPIPPGSYLRTMTTNILGDSEYVKLYTRNSYLNKLIFECQLLRFKDDSTYYYEYLTELHAYLYKYILEYCSHKFTDLKSFADSLSKDLIGVRDDKILTLMFIKILVDKFLDESFDNISITDLNVFEYEKDSCYIKDNINYSRIDFNKEFVEKPNYDSLRRTIHPICGTLMSISKVKSDFNKQVPIQEWLIILDKCKDMLKNDSYINLTYNEKFIALQNSIYIKLKTNTTSTGFKMHVDCELHKIVQDGLPHLSSDMLNDFYVYLATRYAHNQCLLDVTIFQKSKLPKLTAYLKQYPGLSNLEDNRISAYILFLKNSIQNVENSLKLHVYPDVILPQLFDNIHCRYDKTSSELAQIISDYLQNQYKGKKLIFMDYVNFYRCLILKNTKLYLDDLYQNDQLSPREIDEIKSFFETILNENPDLIQNQQHSTTEVLEIITKRDEFKHYRSNPLKLFLVKCQIRIQYFNVYDPTTSTKSIDLYTTTPSDHLSSETMEKISNKQTLSTSNYQTTKSPPIRPKMDSSKIVVISVSCVVLVFLIISGALLYYTFRRKKLSLPQNNH